MTVLRRYARRSHARGVTLIELIVVIVLLAVLGVGFLAMYGDVNRHNAMGSQIAPMTWLAQGAMEAALAERPPMAGNTTTSAPPYTVTTDVAQIPYVKLATGARATCTLRPCYAVTVKVTCRTCVPMTLKAYAYALS